MGIAATITEWVELGALAIGGIFLYKALKTNDTASGDSGQGFLYGIGEFLFGKKDNPIDYTIPTPEHTTPPTAQLYTAEVLKEAIQDVTEAQKQSIVDRYWALTQQHLDWSDVQLQSQAWADVGLNPMNAINQHIITHHLFTDLINVQPKPIPTVATIINRADLGGYDVLKSVRDFLTGSWLPQHSNVGVMLDATPTVNEVLNLPSSVLYVWNTNYLVPEDITWARENRADKQMISNAFGIPIQ